MQITRLPTSPTDTEDDECTHAQFSIRTNQAAGCLELNLDNSRQGSSAIFPRGGASLFSAIFEKNVEGRVLTLLGLQSRFGDNLGQITWNLSALSPKRD